MTLIQWPGLLDSQEDLDREASASPQAAPVPSPAPSPTPTPPAAVPASPTLEYRGLGRLEPVPETDSPTRKVPLVLLPSRSEQVAELVETVRSSSSSGPRVRASAAGAGAGAAAPLLELLVSRPAGAGGNSYARSDAREKQREGREVRELEEELQALRAKHQDCERREERQEHRLQAERAIAEELRAELAQQATASSAKQSAAEAQLRQIQSELNSESLALQSADSWKSEAQSHAASLSAAELRVQGAAEKALRAKRHAQELERQRKELVRASSMQTSRRMREELECAVAEKQESERRLKKALPRLEKLHAEEMRLRAGLEQEAEACAAQRSQLKEECLELTKAKDLLQKQRRFLKAEAEKCERLTLEASEAESQRRAAQVDLAKCQRLRQEEHKRWVAEREVLRRGLSPPRRQLSRSPPRRGADAPGDRLLDMIQVAKERAEQRRHLSDATEEVREQARALEELLAREQAATEFVQAV